MQANPDLIFRKNPYRLFELINTPFRDSGTPQSTVIHSHDIFVYNEGGEITALIKLDYREHKKYSFRGFKPIDINQKNCHIGLHL